MKLVAGLDNWIHQMMKPAASKLKPASAAILSGEDVAGYLSGWRRVGLKCALVTLVGIEGSTPRSLGAQMVVAENGRYKGYFSGGCVESSVAKEAMDAIAERRNRLVRYGKGSPYIDLKLPCGSGLDLYFDQAIEAEVLDGMDELRARRCPYVLEFNLETAASRVVKTRNELPPLGERRGNTFRRAYIPTLHVVIIGSAPVVPVLANVASSAGFETSIYSPNEQTREELRLLGHSSTEISNLAKFNLAELDRWSAVVVAFHEHEWEVPVLASVLNTPFFYVGAIGSKRAQANRLDGLRKLGFCQDALERVRGSIGSIPSAKSRITLAVGVLAEIVAEAKTAGILT